MDSSSISGLVEFIAPRVEFLLVYGYLPRPPETCSGLISWFIFSDMVRRFLLPLLTVDIESGLLSIDSRIICVGDAIVTFWSSFEARREGEQNLQFDIAKGWLESIHQQLQFAIDRNWLDFWTDTHVLPLTKSDLKLSLSECIKDTLILINHLCYLTSFCLFLKTYDGCFVVLRMLYGAQTATELLCIDLVHKSTRHRLYQLNSLIQQMEISFLRYYTSLLVLGKQAFFSSYRECAWSFARSWLLCPATNATSRCFPRQRELCVRSFQQHECDIVRSCFELYASYCYAFLHLESLLSEVGLPMISRECNMGILLDDPTTFDAVLYDALSSFLCIWHGLPALPNHIQEMELLADQRLLHIFVRCRRHVSTQSALTALFELLLQQNFPPISRQRHVLCVSCERSASSSLTPRQEEFCSTLRHADLQFTPPWFKQSTAFDIGYTVFIKEQSRDLEFIGQLIEASLGWLRSFLTFFHGSSPRPPEDHCAYGFNILKFTWSFQVQDESLFHLEGEY